MKLVVLLGSDDRLASRHRRALFEEAEAAGATVERIDVDADGDARLIEAVCVPSLFNPIRAVDVRALDSIGDDALAELARSAEASDAFVVATTATLPAGTKRRLPHHEVIECRPPRGVREITSRLRDEAGERKVTLSASQLRSLADRCADDPVRAYQVLDSLATAQIMSPSDRQLEVLLGSASPTVRPWELFAALERGSVEQALTDASTFDTSQIFAFVGWIRPRLLAAARCRAENISSVDAAGHVSDNQAVLRDAVKWARRFGPRVDEAVHAVGVLDDQLRTTGADSGVAFDVTLTTVARLLG
jgi:hypothetical protein